MGAMILLIKGEYLNYQKDPEDWKRWFRIILRNNILQLTLLDEYDTCQKALKLWSTLVKKDPYPSSLFDCDKPIIIPTRTEAKQKY